MKKDSVPVDPAHRLSIEDWLRSHAIDEVEAIVPDMTGIARGKIMPAKKFSEEYGMRLPEAIFLQTVTGDYPEDYSMADPADIDIVLRPDPNTIRMVPWVDEPTAVVIHDAYYLDGTPVEMAPRHVLRRIIELYRNHGWEPVVAPELEFYLVKPNTDADYPLEPPIGRSGRAEIGRQSYSIDAVNEFDPLFEDVYDYCEAQEIEIDTLIHEAGAAQMEVNLLHGNPLELADQAFLFKRTVREAALRHKMYATFMAKPMEKEPGSAMHIHQSVNEAGGGRNIFSNDEGEPEELFFSHIAGMQKFLPPAMPLLAPTVNSYRRITRYLAAPINVQWGYDNRTAGLRVPVSAASARRVENRLAGADANPYLAIAASLACGYLGMLGGLKPSEPIRGSAYEMPYELPRNIEEGLRMLRECQPLIDVLGERFVRAYTAVKEGEVSTFLQVISSWEREYLLLNV
jgi:glutamine synthetase